MKCLLLLLYSFYKYIIMFLYGVFAIILCLYDITYTHSLFWITMLFLSLIQFFAYANGLKAQLENQFIKDFNETIKKTLEEQQQKEYNQFRNN
jgi:c-di-AMP phosphodiesterase-like protein